MRSGFSGVIVRAILCIVSAVAGVLGLLVGWAGFSLYIDIKNAESVRLPIDLSKPGEYRGRFRRRFITEHGEQLRVEVNPGFESQEEMLAALEGFAGRLTIAKADGDAIHQEDVTARTFSEARFPGCGGHAPMPLHTPFLICKPETRTFEECTITLTVAEPAAGMQRIEQQLVSKCVFCRTAEGLKKLFHGAFGIVGGALVMVSLLLGRSFAKRLKAAKGRPITAETGLRETPGSM